MKKKNRSGNFIYFIFILLLPTNVYAYLDPGSGSALITAIFSFFAAIVYTVKKYFYKSRNERLFISQADGARPAFSSHFRFRACLHVSAACRRGG